MSNPASRSGSAVELLLPILSIDGAALLLLLFHRDKISNVEFRALRVFALRRTNMQRSKSERSLTAYLVSAASQKLSSDQFRKFTPKPGKPRWLESSSNPFQNLNASFTKSATFSTDDWQSLGLARTRSCLGRRRGSQKWQRRRQRNEDYASDLPWPSQIQSYGLGFAPAHFFCCSQGRRAPRIVLKTLRSSK